MEECAPLLRGIYKFYSMGGYMNMTEFHKLVKDAKLTHEPSGCTQAGAYTRSLSAQLELSVRPTYPKLEP